MLDDTPVVFYSNHPSWWDAVVYFHLGRTLFRDRIGYGPVKQVQLARYPVLDRLGLFGIDLNSFKGSARFLSIASALFSRPRTMLWISAEGKFTDPRQRPIVLRPGISHLSGVAKSLVFVPLAIEYVFWNQKTPELLLRFGIPVVSRSGQERRDLQAKLEGALTATLDSLQQESALRDPSLFVSLLEGQSRISVIYDCVRRMRAIVRRDPFDARHSE